MTTAATARETTEGRATPSTPIPRPKTQSALPAMLIGVAADIDDVHEQGGIHGNLGIAHGPEERGAAVINGNKGVGKRGNGKVGDGACHNGLLYLPEKKAQQGTFQKQNQDGDDD